MEPFLTIKGIDWLYKPSPSKEDLAQLIETYDLHELIEEDIMERSTQDKIDVYDQCLFIVLHFPKYSGNRNKYLLNEFNIILAKNYIVTLTRYDTTHIQIIKEQYKQTIQEAEHDEHYKFSPYYILYKLIDVMYDKVIRSIRVFARDLHHLEEVIFEDHILDKQTLEKIMQKRRNIVMLKHTIMPHSEIIEELQEATMKFFGGELDVYFEDLSYKIDKILSSIEVQSENIDSLYDTYNAMVSMKTNSIITVLTIFTAIMGVMTLITGLFGMNVPLPFSQDTVTVVYILGAMLLLGLSMLLFFDRKGRM